MNNSDNAAILSKVAEAKRLFILRPDHLGDLVLFSGALKHIRNRWQTAKISLCMHSYGLELLKHCPHVDRLIDIRDLQSGLFGDGHLSWLPEFRGVRRLRSMSLRFAELSAGWRYISDLAILPVLAPEFHHHNLMSRVPAKVRIGIAGNTTNQTVDDDRIAERWYSTRMDATKFAWDQEELEVCQSFLEFLGITSKRDDLLPEFWTTQQDIQAAEGYLPRSPGSLLLGLAPSVTSVVGKNLPPLWFRSVVDGLRGYKIDVAVFGGKDDSSVCAGVAHALGDLPNVSCVLNLAGRTGVRELVECMKRCDLILSQETAALHIATALRRPVAGIVGGGHFGRFFPWGNAQLIRVVHKVMDCYGCNWKCQYSSIRCISEIAPDTATIALRSLLEDVVKPDGRS